MVSLYRACKRTGRTLIIDLYAAEILRATGNNIPQSDWPNVAVYVPQYQRIQIKRSGRFDLLDPHKTNRVFVERLEDLAPGPQCSSDQQCCAILIMPAACPAHAPSGRNGMAISNRNAVSPSSPSFTRGIPLDHAHTSGHASIPDLKRLAGRSSRRCWCRSIPMSQGSFGTFPGRQSQE
jgi:ribonuclease J